MPRSRSPAIRVSDSLRVPDPEWPFHRPPLRERHVTAILRRIRQPVLQTADEDRLADAQRALQWRRRRQSQLKKRRCTSEDLLQKQLLRCRHSLLVPGGGCLRHTGYLSRS
ncbi:unnamed protein product [Symbiodinium natans]|uniref:Uncharacterized protein n=1 Tax=Symbiodinium natans TaxID=878477 RepID=A0A812JS09_9DINO|nr:unnamed protein product [Symbiodinium natans]